MNTSRTVRVVGAVALVAAVSALVPSVPARAASDPCQKWASSTGSDANDGSSARPYRSLDQLARGLTAGQTGCLPGGQTYEAVEGYGIVKASSGTAASPVTIRSGPGGRASVLGWVDVRGTGHDLVFSDLNFVGSPLDANGQPVAPKSSHINVDGDRIALIGNDITNPYGICVDAGGIDAYNKTYSGDRADDFVLRDNRIHGCGMSSKVVYTDKDSGVHGVYLVNTLNAQVTQNLIYSNRYRGLQTWPKAEGSVIANNLFDANATQVNIGSALPDGYPWYSSNTKVRDNIMSNRVTAWEPAKNPSQVYGYFPENSPTYGNEVFGNCLASRDAGVAGNGLAAHDNIVGDAQYTNRSAADFRLQPGSPCLGKGPASIQPQGKADLSVVLSPSGTGRVGDDLVYKLTVQNRGQLAAASASVSLSTAAGAVVLSAPASCSGAGPVVCALGDVAAGATVNATITVAPTRAGSAAAKASVTSKTVEATPADNVASASTALTGSTCTKVGTPGDDVLTGTAGADVVCGLSGSDVLNGAGGDDLLYGGSGADTVSFAGASGAMTANLDQQASWNSGAGTDGYDQFTSVEALAGSPYGDLLVGSPGNDRIDGAGGNDELWGYAGNDVLVGGDGNDVLNGGDGSDRCIQNAGAGSSNGCEAAA